MVRIYLDLPPYITRRGLRRRPTYKKLFLVLFLLGRFRRKFLFFFYRGLHETYQSFPECPHRRCVGVCLMPGVNYCTHFQVHSELLACLLDEKALSEMTVPCVQCLTPNILGLTRKSFSLIIKPGSIAMLGYRRKEVYFGWLFPGNATSHLPFLDQLIDKIVQLSSAYV